MALTITNNISSLIAQNNLTNTENSLQTSLQRLSSGLKINSGADGPAALVISQEQQAQMAGLQSAIANTSEGISLVQTTEGALNEVNTLLVQIRGLALSAANNAVNDPQSLAADQAQVANALDTIDRIAQNTQFGTRNVLDGSAGMNGSASSNNVAFLRATSASSAGSYAINVTQAAEQAVVTAGAVQTGALANNETLTINGTQISLAAGSSQAQVESAINAATAQTGVVAATNVQGKSSNTTFSLAEAINTGALYDASTVSGGTDTGVASSSTLLTNLSMDNANTNLAFAGLASGATLNFAITTETGTQVNGSQAVTGTTTVGDLLTTINNDLAQANSKATASISADGVLTIKAPNDSATNQLATSFSSSGVTDNLSSGFTANGITSSSTLSASTTLNNLLQTSTNYGGTDALAFTGTDVNGNPVTIGNLSVGATSTVQDVLNALTTGFGSGYAASFTNGVISVSNSNAPNATQLAFSISDANGDVGANSGFGTNAFTTDYGQTRLSTANFGSAASISVTSNQGSSTSSSGFGTGLQTATGQDIAGTIGGFTATGQGNVLTGDPSQGAAGITIQVTGLNPNNDTQSVTGNQGTVTVTNNSLVFQIGANANQTAQITVDSAKTTALGIGVANDQFANLSQIDIRSESGAQDAIKIIDQAISDVSTLRGSLGAFQEQTLSATQGNLQTTLANTTSAESTITDTDYASETANYTKDQVLMQAGTTVLANANQLAQLVLNLLPHA